MSGAVALAAARKRRVNVPVVQNSTNNQNIVNDNSLEDNKNNIQRLSIKDITLMHTNRINYLKKELDSLKSEINTKNVNQNNSKVTFSDTNNITNEKISKLEIETTSINNKSSKLNEDFISIKKDTENFKIVFLNINKVINEIKKQLDENTNELNNIKSFLNSHSFVENSQIINDKKDEQLDDETKDDENQIKMSIQEN